MERFDHNTGVEASWRVAPDHFPRRILITGATGFVGTHLLTECRARYPNAQLFGLALHPGILGHADASISLMKADISDREKVRQAVAASRPDLVLHLAGQASVAASWADPSTTLMVNAGGAVNLLEALRAERLETRVVLVGSGEQYGLVRPEENPVSEDVPFRPANPYAVAKVAQDLFGYQYFTSFGMPIMRVRPFNHFGPGQPDAFVIPSFAHQIAHIELGMTEAALHVGNLEARRDFLPVTEVVRAYLDVAERGRPGAAYNIGSGCARAIGEVLRTLLTLTSTPIEIRTDAARLRPADVPLLVADTSLLRRDTGWEPRGDFGLALRATLDYWREVVRRELGDADPAAVGGRGRRAESSSL